MHKKEWSFFRVKSTLSAAMSASSPGNDAESTVPTHSPSDPHISHAINYCEWTCNLYRLKKVFTCAAVHGTGKDSIPERRYLHLRCCCALQSWRNACGRKDPVDGLDITSLLKQLLVAYSPGRTTGWSIPLQINAPSTADGKGHCSFSLLLTVCRFPRSVCDGSQTLGKGPMWAAGEQETKRPDDPPPTLWWRSTRCTALVKM